MISYLPLFVHSELPGVVYWFPHCQHGSCKTCCIVDPAAYELEKNDESPHEKNSFLQVREIKV